MRTDGFSLNDTGGAQMPQKSKVFLKCFCAVFMGFLLAKVTQGPSKKEIELSAKEIELSAEIRLLNTRIVNLKAQRESATVMPVVAKNKVSVAESPAAQTSTNERSKNNVSAQRANLTKTDPASKGNSQLKKYLTHREFHKMTNVGMKVGKGYWVESMLFENGDYLADPIDNDSIWWITVRGSENQFAEKMRSRLYDLRGHLGCFKVALFGHGDLLLTYFHEGDCADKAQTH